MNMSLDEYKKLTSGGKSPKRQIAGYQSKIQGEAFEQIVDYSCEFYKKQGVAFIEKTPEPMKVLERLEDGKFIACFEKAAQPDYKGTLAGGLTVCFDAKHTFDSKIAKSRVTPYQAKSLEYYQKFGAECFIVVGFSMKSFFRVPWYVWSNMENIFGFKHLKLKDLDTFRINMNKNGCLDFLGRA